MLDLKMQIVYGIVDQCLWRGTTYLVGFFFKYFAKSHLQQSSNSKFNFSASIGRVFGICLGASTISLIEIIHFFLIRICGYYLLKCFTSSDSKDSIEKVIESWNKHRMSQDKLHSYRNRSSKLFPMEYLEWSISNLDESQ